MTCAEARELIEPIASGDPESDAFRAHVSGCVTCASALAQAIRIERALAAVPSPAAPARFAQSVRARIRRERWRHEQRVDRAFNVTIAIGLFAALAGGLSLLNLASLAQLLLVTVEALVEATRQPPVSAQAGSLLTVGLTAGLLAAALAIWWWLERRVELQEQPQ